MRVVRNITKILLFAVIVSFGHNHLSSNGILWVGHWGHPEALIMEINDVEFAKTFFEKPESIFIDLRTKRLFKNGHIPGAISFPPKATNKIILKEIEKYSKDSVIVIYDEKKNDKKARRPPCLFNLETT